MSSVSGAAKEQLPFLQQETITVQATAKPATVRLRTVRQGWIAADQDAAVRHADIGVFHIRRVAHRAIECLAPEPGSVPISSLCHGDDIEGRL